MIELRTVVQMFAMLLLAISTVMMLVDMWIEATYILVMAGIMMQLTMMERLDVTENYRFKEQ